MYTRLLEFEEPPHLEKGPQLEKGPPRVDGG